MRIASLRPFGPTATFWRTTRGIGDSVVVVVVSASVVGAGDDSQLDTTRKSAGPTTRTAVWVCLRGLGDVVAAGGRGQSALFADSRLDAACSSSTTRIG